LGNAYYGRGIIHSDKNNYQASVDDYNKALEILGEDSDVLTSRGAAKFYLDDWQGSKADFTRALELEDDNVRAMNNRAVVEFCLGELKEASEDYAKALTHMPTERLLLAGMAVTLHALDENDNKARELWKGLVKIEPRYKDANWAGQQLLWPEPLVNEAKKLIAKL
jgi:tetratricopeptide (TPR) repeat protein